MKKINVKVNKLLMSLLLIMLLLLFGGLTYAFFTAMVTNGDMGSSVIIQTGTLKIKYSDTEYINFDNVLPGSNFTKTITVTNEGNVTVDYDLVWIDLLNTFVDKKDLTMGMTCTSNKSTCDDVYESEIVGSGQNKVIKGPISIDAGETHTYLVTINFLETGSNQDVNQGKTLSGKIGIIESNTRTMPVYGYLKDINGDILSNTTIVLHSKEMKTTTDVTGFYYFDSVPLGSHEIEIFDDTSSLLKNYSIDINYNDTDYINNSSVRYGIDREVIGMNIDIKENKLIYSFISTETKVGCFETSNGVITKYYEYEDNNSSNMVCSKEVDIPSKIGDFFITEIGDNAFEKMNITKVTIPNTVNSIGYSAFQNNKITTLNIPESVTEISSFAFNYNKISNLILSNNLREINYEAFENNLLTDVNIPASVTYLGMGAFMNNKLQTVSLSESLDAIDGFVFKNNNIVNITIPASTVYI